MYDIIIIMYANTFINKKTRRRILPVDEMLILYNFSVIDVTIKQHSFATLKKMDIIEINKAIY